MHSFKKTVSATLAGIAFALLSSTTQAAEGTPVKMVPEEDVGSFRASPLISNCQTVCLLRSRKRRC